MQERSYTFPMCSASRTSHVSTSVANVSIDNHSISNRNQNEIDSSTSTPELNLLLDKLTEILRFRSNNRRNLTVKQQQSQPSISSTTNLKRLQSSSFEPLHNTADVSSITVDGSSTLTGAWKSSTIHNKSSILNRSSQHHHHHHHKHHITHIEKKHRLPSLLQRLIEEGNLIKEAVRRLKTQRFSSTFNQEQNNNNNNSTSTNSSIQTLSNITTSIKQLTHSPIQTTTTSSPKRSLSWFLSSNVFSVNTSTTNHNSGNTSPLCVYYSSGTHDRTPMEIGIYDG